MIASIVQALLDNYKAIIRGGLYSYSEQTICEKSKTLKHDIFNNKQLSNLIYKYYNEEEKPDDVVAKIEFK